MWCFLTMGQIVTSQIMYLIGIAIFVIVANTFWWFMCEALTTFERHYTWTAHRKHLTFKFYFFKIITLSVVFVARLIIRRWPNEVFTYLPIFKFIAASSKIINCSLSVDAEQFLILIITEVTVNRATAIFGPWIWYKLWSCCHKASDTSDHGRPDFDLAMEYLNVLYRQYIIFLGLPLFPWMPLFGVIGNFIDYPLNKWFLLNITRTPPFLRGSMRSFLVFFMFLTTFLSFVMVPIGFASTLWGWYYYSCPTGIYTGDSTNSTNT